MGYAAPLFVLVALSTLAPRWGPSRAWAAGRGVLLAAGAALFAVGTITAVTRTHGALRTTDASEEFAEASIAAVHPGATIEIDIAEPWDQAWLVYYLRGNDISISRPSVYFTGFTIGARRDLPTRTHAEYRIQAAPGRRVVAETPGLYLNRMG